jgi:molecular chaperone DnaK (HSP70)
MAAKPRYLVGIDLGTTHTVVASARLQGDIRQIRPELFEIEQLVGPGTLARRPCLPSFRYHPAQGELSEAQLKLSWEPSQVPGDLEPVLIGEYARLLGSRSAGRLVVSAKSWLSHTLVDRSDAILPWGVDAQVDKVSPVQASASYLAYVKDAWNNAHPDAPLPQQEIVITIPASFDEAARTLTLEAAAMAGLSEVLLIEEPQAVCYDWFLRHREQARAELEGCHLLLVCDIGGGTTDFSLIRIAVEQGELALTRVGVGDHLMLGGDNIDLALAHQAGQMLQGESLGLVQLSALIQQARSAKESLLGATSPAEAALTLLGSGRSLVGGAKTVHLSRQQVCDLALDGFFPLVDSTAVPLRRRQAVVEIGLPYATDPAITRHIVGFLQAHQSVCQEAMGQSATGFVAPDAVLFNGGVFNSPLIRQRLIDQFNQWRSGGVRVLENGHPDLAVAFGAVAYALARRGAQLRIAGGAARSYFLIAESDRGQQGVCLLPRGTPEGTELSIPDRRFVLRVGEPVQFHLATTTDDQKYALGEVIPLDQERFRKLPPLVSTLPRQSHAREEEVSLACWLTEIGTLGLTCVSAQNDQQRWQVEFEIRQLLKQQRAEGGLQFINEADLPPRFGQSAQEIRSYYGAGRKQVAPDGVKKLRGQLEKNLGNREYWDSVTLRALANLLLDGARRRKRSAHHERVWLNLAGYCLRPGFGFAGDPWRIRQIWPIHQKGLQFVGESQIWSEWWTFWRRISGGLSAAQQQMLLSDIEPYLDPAAITSRKLQSEARLKGYEDMLRLAGSLEHIGIKRKIELGDWLCQRLSAGNEPQAIWWALGRLGARVLLHGDHISTVPTSKMYEWLEVALAEDWKDNPSAAFCAVMLVRVSGDVQRDAAERVQQKVIEKLRHGRLPDIWIGLVSGAALEGAELKRLYGEALPVGIKLIV